MEEIDPAVLSAIQNRLDGIRDWIADKAPHIVGDNRRLDARMPEREYWQHCGYQAALRDVLAVIAQLYGHRR